MGSQDCESRSFFWFLGSLEFGTWGLEFEESWEALGWKNQFAAKVNRPCELTGTESALGKLKSES
jgi:hypothetical protein